MMVYSVVVLIFSDSNAWESTMSKGTGWRQFLGMIIGGAYAFSASCANAQITPDNTLPNNSNVTINGTVFNITGGRVVMLKVMPGKLTSPLVHLLQLIALKLIPLPVEKEMRGM